MVLTKRQEKILDKIINEYILSAVPVSSSLLNDKYNFDLSPATLRIEMQRLTEQGFLCQPHTSAGRVPTDKGYRFFVDKVLNKGSNFKIKRRIAEEFKDLENSLIFIQKATKILADNSSNLGISYLSGENILWKEGWEGIFEEPEFKDIDLVSKFTRLVNSLEEGIDELFSDDFLETRVFIGSENPFAKADEFSLITSRLNFPKFQKEGIVAIIGPKRMNYRKNVSLVNLFNELLG